ncbi:MAG: T9SS type A sorting domain-containing protein [Bacteroidetes bacterium]|nr:T9SS type A sorting domain-containing protein [Bacteroidota bacterium]
MKSKQLQFLILIFSILIAPKFSWSQGTTGLRVVAMPGFPFAPADSAYEGQSYSFDVKLVNGTSSVINTPIDIQFRVDSITTAAFTLAQPVLAIGDSATFTVTGYTFNQPQFKVGNNIVVVWPVVNGLAIPVDSFYADVIFVPLSSLSNNDLKYNSIQLFPVPSLHILNLKLNSGDLVEYVRIYSIDGRLVYENEQFIDGFIDIRGFSKGTYIFEAVINGKLGRARFIRN